MSDTVSAQSVTARMLRSPKWYSKSPADVTLDLSISDRAVRIYFILGLKTFQGNISSLGLRQLGILLNVSSMTAKRCMNELVAAGKVQAINSGNGKRMRYMLTSPIFGTKQRALNAGESIVEELVSSPGKRLATARIA